MWNRQREAQLAREILEENEEEASAPNRNPPSDPDAPEELVPAADAAE
jgi:hypothetical protein